ATFHPENARSSPVASASTTRATDRAWFNAGTPTSTSRGPTESTTSRLSAGSRSSSRTPTDTWASSAALPGHAGQEGHIVAEVSREEKAPPDVLPSGATHPDAEVQVLEELADSEGRSLDGRDGEAGRLGDDLRGNAAGQTADHRLALPHRLGDGEAKIVLQRPCYCYPYSP